MSTTKILFCNCTYAQVVPNEVKTAVLQRLCESGIAFEAVADLCEMSARQDASLRSLAEGELKIAACFPRAVKWLFASAKAPLNPSSVEIANMRAQSAEDVLAALFREGLQPNLPPDKVSATNSAPDSSSISPVSNP
jgi:hypothetical protein